MNESENTNTFCSGSYGNNTMQSGSYKIGMNRQLTEKFNKYISQQEQQLFENEIEEREDDMSREILAELQKLNTKINSIDTKLIELDKNVALINHTVSYIKDNNVTKLDIKDIALEFKSDFSSIDKKVASIETKLPDLTTKHDLSESEKKLTTGLVSKSELEIQIKGASGELTGKIAETKTSTIMWSVGIIGTIIAIVSLLFNSNFNDIKQLINKSQQTTQVNSSSPVAPIIATNIQTQATTAKPVKSGP